MTKLAQRRNFLKTLATGAVASVAALPFLSGCNEPECKIEDTFLHHVYFWMKNPSNEEEHKKLRTGLQSLQEIDEVLMGHIGVPAATNRDVIDNTYQYSLLLIFKNQKDQDIYQEHETHKKFVEDCSDIWEKVTVYDSIAM